MVTNERTDVVQARALAEKAGWGRIHVTVMPAEHARYLAKYLSKERPPCLKRWRLWAAFGEGWEPTRVKDLTRESLFSTIYRACKEWQGWTGKGHFFERRDLVHRMVFMTIVAGLDCGPGTMPKDMNRRIDLTPLFTSRQPTAYIPKICRPHFRVVRPRM